MLRELKNYLAPVTNYIQKIRGYLSNRPFITDLIAKLVITFGVVLIVGGLYLMIADAGASTQIAQTNLKSVVSTVDWVPGIPFFIGDLVNLSASIVGLVSWFIGVDLLPLRIRYLGKTHICPIYLNNDIYLSGLLSTYSIHVFWDYWGSNISCRIAYRWSFYLFSSFKI